MGIRHVGRARLAATAWLLAGASCASVDFDPTGADTGHFRSSAMAFTFLGHDHPQSALLIARGNAADSQLPNLVVEEEIVFPYLWKLDFLLDLVSLRFAIVRGTWGPAGEPKP